MPITQKTHRLLRLSGANEIATDIDSLFFVVRFPDEQARQTALRHDVSVNIVKQITDGRHNVYDNPIEHIAATAYPVIPGLGPWVADTTDPLGLTYHKECLPTGEYLKESEGLEFEISPNFLDEAITVFDEMQSNAVAVPLQLTHTGDGNKLGDVIQLYKAPRTKQLPQPARKLSNKARAHVLKLAQERGANKMTLDEIAALLGIEFTEGLDDTGKMDAIKAYLAQVKGNEPAPAAAASQQGQPAAQLGAAPASAPAAPAAAPAANPAPAAAQGATNTNPVQQAATQAVNGVQIPGIAQVLNPQSITVKLSKQAFDAVKGGKQAMLDSAVLAGTITPAESAELAKQHLTDKAVNLSLSSDSTCPIKSYLDTRKLGQQGWQASGRTPANNGEAQLTLSQPGNTGGTSPLAANRAEREQRQTGFSLANRRATR